MMGLIKFTRSDKRTEPVKVLLSHDVTLTSCGAIYAHFGSTHFFPSSFKIETKDRVIYIDPIAVDDSAGADYILITHAHQDHFSLADIEKLVKKDTVVICPKKVANKLKGYTVKMVRPGEIVRLDRVELETVPAYSLGFPSHPKSSGNVGYIIGIDGQRIYHAGDTDLVNEIKTVKCIDAALVPIDGGNLTMKTGEAVELVNSIKPKIAIPMHYTLQENSTEQFKQMVNEETDVIILTNAGS